ncbi:Alpha/beta hydrolase fold-containing protein 15 [Elsinoe fawcettii]|nr:Alpha/beta hydrolase fold-containing protein 15 [Elsinoe fawcettii]
MSLEYDPEFFEAVKPMFAHPMPPIPEGDVQGRRERLDAIFGPMLAALPAQPNIKQSTLTIDTPSGPLDLHVFQPSNLPSGPTPAVLLLHPGGHIALTSKVLAPGTALLAAQLNLPIYSVEYRLAPEHPYPADLDDSFSALTHLSSNATSLNIDPSKIIVYGASAGGGLAAALALRARDAALSPPIKGVVLVYPMLDDRVTTAVPAVKDKLVWTEGDQVTGWSAYLGDLYKSASVPLYAAPGRAEKGDLKGLPPHWIDVGGLELFAGEDLAYAQKLTQDGVEVEFHLLRGVPHGFDTMAPQTGVARRALEGRERFIKELLT